MPDYGTFCSKRDTIINLMTDENFVADSLSGILPEESGLKAELARAINQFFPRKEKGAKVTAHPLLLLEFLTAVTSELNDEFMGAEPLLRSMFSDKDGLPEDIEDMFKTGSFFHNLAKISDTLTETEALLIRHHIKCKFFSIPELLPQFLADEDIEIARKYMDNYEAPPPPLENPFLEEIFGLLNKAISSKRFNLSAEELYYLMIAERFSLEDPERERYEVDIIANSVPDEIKEKLAFTYFLERINESSQAVFSEILDDVYDHVENIEPSQEVS